MKKVEEPAPHMSQENPKLDAAVESQVSKTARPGAPGTRTLEVCGSAHWLIVMRKIA